MIKLLVAEAGVANTKHQEAFVTAREEILAPVTEAFRGWNEAVAFLVEGFHKHTHANKAWQQLYAQ